MYRYPDAVIMVFCKAPVPGQVKTRLIPPLTGEEAAQLHCELTKQTLISATRNNLCPVQLWCTPTTDHPFFFSLEQKYAVERRKQQGGELGERMRRAFDKALAQYKYAVIIGCDCPSLTGDDIAEALACLAQNNTCVLAPAEDGGYVLIGLSRQHTSLFEDMPWGTEKVMEYTLARLRAQLINYMLLKTQWDVDALADLNRYRAMERPD